MVVGRSEAIPHADEILQTGTQVDLSQSEVTVEGLASNTSYTLAVAAQNGTAYSEVQFEFHYAVRVSDRRGYRAHIYLCQYRWRLGE